MYLATYTRQRFDCAAPHPSQVRIIDIAVGLSRENRFANQTEQPYSVAQHCLLVEEIVSRRPNATKEARLGALLHDAHEAYLRDIPTPVAVEIEVLAPGVLEQIKNRFQRAIHDRYGLQLSAVDRQYIVHADLQALKAERQDLRIDPNGHWPMLDGVYRSAVDPIRCMSSEEAFLRFMARFTELIGEMLGHPPGVAEAAAS